MKKALLTAAVVSALAGVAAVPTSASAGSITFNFTCQVFTAPDPDVCSGAGSFGTLTLSDSAIDSNRVDIDWTFTPPWGVNIERVLLNWAGPPAFPLTAPDLYVVSQAAPAGSTTPIPGVTHIIGNNGQPQGTTWQFDIRVNESSPQGLTFSGSLYLTLGNGASIVDLSPSSFLTTSNNLGGSTPPLYALFATVQGPAVPTSQTASSGSEFWGGATSTSVPEPATLSLLGLGLFAAAVGSRRVLRRR